MQESGLEFQGIKFTSIGEMKQAQEEYKNIVNIRSKVDLTNETVVNKLYTNLINKQYFTTVIGYHFLLELQDILVDDFQENREELLPIPIMRRESSELFQFRRSHKTLEEYEQIEKKNKRLTFVVLVLAILISGMVYITLTNKNVGYVNVEQKVIDKYSSWEEDLKEREERLNQLEK